MSTKTHFSSQFIKEKLQCLHKLQNTKIPEKLTEEFNLTNLRTVLSVVGTDPVERPYTPLVKQLMPESGRIPLTGHLYDAEKKYISETANIIQKHYGDPVFDYSKVSQDDYPRVDAGINFVKAMSPMITPGASKRRYEGLLKFHQQKYKFKPDYKILNASINEVVKAMFRKGAAYAEELISKSYKSPFEKQSSNVGGPFYANEKKNHKSGMRGKEYTVKKTKEGIAAYGTDGLAVVPSTIIGRDQQAGLNIPYSEFNSTSDLQKLLNKKDIIKPSKARVVWATPRVANNALAPVVHPVTEYLKEYSPMFCGYLSREERAVLMQTAAKVTDNLKLQSANVDYSSYDLTVSPELIVCGAQLLIDNIIMLPQQEQIFGAMVSNFIYTPYTCMNPINKSIFTGCKLGGIPSGSILTNLLGSVINAIASTYAKMKMYGIDEIIIINQKYANLGAPSLTVLGDDVGTGFKNSSDIERFSKILKDDFNFDVSGDGNKTAYGVFFLQERHMEDKVLYPTARTVAKSLGVERPKGLNWTLGDLGFASKLANMAENVDLEDITAMLMSLDKTKLGLFSPEGIQLTVKSFLAATAEESKKHDTTALETLYDGDPSKIDRFDITTGQPSSKFVSGYFTLLNSVYDKKSYLEFEKTFK